MTRVTEADKERMRELRRQGLGLRVIAEMTEFSMSTIHNVVKDVELRVGIYQKELPVGIFKGSIIDIETTGLDRDRDEIIAFGYLEGNVIYVIQRVEIRPSQFYDIIEEKMTQLSQPYYAYNAKFEESFLQAKLGIKFNFTDIFEPWMKRAEAEGRRYPSLDKLAPLPREYFREEVTPSRAIPRLWNAYVKTKRKRCISPIVRHVMEDLIQSLYVLAHS